MTADSPAEGLTSAAALERLARAYGVATRYDDADGVPHAVAPETVVAVLASFGVDASTPRSAADAVADHLRQRSSRVLPPVVVVRSGQPASTIARVTPGTRAQAQVTTDAGAVIGCSTPAGPGPAPADASADLPPRHQQVIRIPALPPGWHQLSVQAGAESRSCTLLATPPGGARRPERRRRWGWAAQLYALPSSTSWGIGDLADLAELASVSGREFGADLVVCNPLHAGALTRPVEDSPYSPSSRQFHNPIYLRVDATPEYRAAPPDVRRLVDAHRPDVGADLIDRERVWRAKQAALEMLFEQSDPALRAERLHRARAEHGPAVDTFALFSAAAERYGRRWPDWPAGLRSADDALVPALRAQLAGRIDFHVWLQALCREQLLAAAEAARAGGMAVGIVHDLAVGVDPGGADAWARPDLLVRGMTIGAPPDGFYSAGQDWGLPPWNPHRLADLGCAPFRDVLRAALCGAGGVRIDHILGLFRLWWIPAGAGAAAGTYVHYDHQALLAALAVEAHRAEAMVIGEDLGTVPPYVARALSDHGILGSEVLWFARDASDPSRPRRPAEWRAAAAASVTTHDLPTAAGFLTGDHVRLRAEVGLLGHGEAVEAARAAEERQALLDLLRTEGLLPLVPDGEPLVPDGEPPDAQEIVLALHAVLARTPCQILLACPGDALGDLRQPNLPGTDRYPNWRMPLAVPTPSGPRPVPLEEFLASPATRRLAEVLRAPSGVRPGRDQPETATPPAHLASRGRSLQDEV